MAKRLVGAKLNLLSAREVFNAREAEWSDGGGLLLRCSGAQAAWVFRYTSAPASDAKWGSAPARGTVRKPPGRASLLRGVSPRRRARCWRATLRSTRSTSAPRRGWLRARPSVRSGKTSDGRSSRSPARRAPITRISSSPESGRHSRQSGSVRSRITFRRRSGTSR